MKKLILYVMILIIAIGSDMMKDYRSVPPDRAILLKSGKQKFYCSVCGMNLATFYRTNHLAKHNKTTEQYCSITCMVEDMVIHEKNLTDFKVVDNDTLKFIPSKDAFFVVGSKKPGTMSMISKYAFGTKKSALKFQNQNGGKIMSFDELIKLVKNLQAKEMEAIKKKQLKAIKKGAMMYKKICAKTDKKFKTTAKAKAFLIESKICGNIKAKKLQAISLYLTHRN